MAREEGGFWVFAAAVFFYPMSWIGKRRYLHAERLPRTGPVLLVMNHISHIDPPNDAVFVHSNKRVPRFMAKESVFKIPVLGPILARAGGIPVYRGSGRAQDSLRVAHEALETGQLVLMYPEGSITKDPAQWPMRSRTGVARLALEHDVPVIPAARWGTHNILNGYTKRFRPFPRKDVHTLVGEPVDLSAYRGKPVTNALLREVTEVIMREVVGLVAELRGEPAPEGFFQPGGLSISDPRAEGQQDEPADGS